MLIRNLSFSYGERRIFDNLTIEIPEGAITAVSGPSGCGKTTLLRLMAGLEKPDKGNLMMPSCGRISFMFQENRLLTGLNAIEQVSVVLPGHGHEKAAKWLDAVGLKGEYETPITKLSGGMQKRVSLARCLAYGEDKDLLILDEPFSGIDPDRIESLVRLLRSMRKNIIYSAHDALSLSLADSVIKLGDG